VKRAWVYFVIFLLLVSAVIAAPSSKKYIVKFKDEAAGKDFDKTAKKDLKVKYKYDIIPAAAMTLEEEELAEILSNENVLSVEEDEILHISLSNSAELLNVDDVWTEGFVGNGKTICVIDTGVDESHPAIPTLTGWSDFVNGQPTPYDDHGHGTHVSGIAVSRDATYQGMATAANLMVGKVCSGSGNCYTSDLIAGIEWCAAQGADVLSVSIGGGLYDEPCDDVSFAAACNNAADLGVVVIAASGNDGNKNYLNAPACGSQVLAVGAINDNDLYGYFSNGGPLLDVMAPGIRVVSTWPGNNFVEFTGTSMSAPHVSGIAALLLEANPSLTPEEVRNVLKETAVDLGDLGFDYNFGYGRVDAYAAYQEIADPCVDEDNDGVLDYTEECLDGKDICSNSVLDGIDLNKNQYAQNWDFDWFEVGPDNSESLVYDMEVAQGCTCKQIALELGVGEGQIKKGCSPGIMKKWTGINAVSERGNKLTGGVITFSSEDVAGLFGLGMIIVIALGILAMVRRK